jgi:protein associated with RNAse G/E
VLLVPRSGEYVATFYDEAHPAGVQVYVDLATDHGWIPIRPGVTEFHLIDMDLDVIRTVDAGVYVDDEDEFAEHRIEMDYPADVVDRITAASDQLYQAVKAQQPPFDGTDREWFRRGRA